MTDANAQPQTDVVARARFLLNEDMSNPYTLRQRKADLFPELLAEVEKLRTAVSLHFMVITQTPDDSWECCAACGIDWPCSTALAANPTYPHALGAAVDGSTPK